MKKSFWQKINTPIGCDSYYDWWDKRLKKYEKLEELPYNWINSTPVYNKHQMAHLLKKGWVTQEQCDEVIARYAELEKRWLEKYKNHLEEKLTILDMKLNGIQPVYIINKENKKEK